MVKKIIFRTVKCIIIFALCALISCGINDTDDSAVTASVETSEAPLTGAQEAYEYFLQGKATAKLDGDEVFISDIVNTELLNFAYFDMNGDGIDELHIASNFYYIFTFTDGELVKWHTGTGYETPLNNGAILSLRRGGAPEHIDYAYIMPNTNGEDKIYFSEYHVENEASGDYYFFENVEVTKEQWEQLTKPYLSIGNDLIVWSTR